MNRKYLPGIPFSLLLLFFLSQSATTIGASPILLDDYNGPPPGARSLGLGNAAIALENDAFSSFYNPAALCFLQDNVMVFDFHYAKGTARKFDLPNVEGMMIDFVAMLNHSGGLSWHPLIRKSIDAETTYYDTGYGDTLQVNTHYEYRADQVYVTMTTLATEPLESLLRKSLLGINIKYYRAQCAEATVVRTKSSVVDAYSNIDSGNGIGIDIGFAYATEYLIFGLSVKDAFSRVYWNDYDTDCVHTKTGAGITYGIAERVFLSTDIRYNWGNRIAGSFTGLEMNFLKKTERKTKHIPVGETENNEENVYGGIFRIGAQIPDLSDRKGITYTAGFSSLYSRLRFDIALMGEQEEIAEGDFSLQLSLLVLY